MDRVLFLVVIIGVIYTICEMIYNCITGKTID